MGSCISIECGSSSSSSLSSAVVLRRRNANGPKSVNSPFGNPKNEPLYRVPGRLFLNGSSEVASLFTQQGKKGINQDAMIVWENFISRKDTVFCGIFDGHGPYGHLVAKRVRDSLPLRLLSHWEVKNNKENILQEISLDTAACITSKEAISGPVDQSRMPNETDRTERQQKIFQALKHSFLRAFRGMDRELRMHTNIDCLCSGTTAVTLVKQGEFLVIGNVGDSRAILGRRDKDNSLTAVQLTVDLKPDNPGEADRIMKCKGRVFALQDEPGIARLWLPNSDSPGLAMARAFSDFCLKDFGLISVPEISCHYLTESDEFVVLATDGIWDVLSNEEVVDIVASSPARSSAAKTLVESAVHAWKCKYPTAKVDDCTVLCLFLDSGVACADSTVESRECSAAADQVNAGYGEDHYLPIDHLDISKHEETHLGSEEDQYAVEEVSYIGTLVNHPGLSHRRATRRHPRKHDEADSYH